MPKQAIAAGAVDEVLALGDISRRLVELCHATQGRSAGSR